MINMIKINNLRAEVGMQQFDLYRQMVFKGFESFVVTQDSINKQKQESKMSRIGRKIPNINKNEYFKFNSKVDFSVQRRALKRVGASEVGSLFMGADYLEEMFIVRILKSIGREMPFEENLSMKKGKALENLIIDEFVKTYDKNIHILHKNKYSNGIDKYNYFKKVGKSDNLVGATIDAWFVNREGDAELLETKCSDSFQIQCGASEYNRIGNFLDNKYFFKYYVQVQMQLACTGLKKGNLFFLFGGDTTNCVIERDDAFIAKIMFYMVAFNVEINNAFKYMRSYNDIESASNEELVERIKLFLNKSEFYNTLAQLDFRQEFLKFVKLTNLEVENDLVLKDDIFTLNEMIKHISKVEAEKAKEAEDMTKVVKLKVKEKIQDMISSYSISDNIYYNFEGILFSLNMRKRAIKDRFKVFSDSYTQVDGLSNFSKAVSIASHFADKVASVSSDSSNKATLIAQAV
ncbi:YqaJ viral recombinase family protein [Borrelia venezuelensis]|uniref:YqaJ viral recombinase family protein n=1 Tax=Borrelia venezuelensis TaxID=1653839 RepID=UPI001FF4ED33|nr:YqaJ viral recombinase family protein [Borrelia venezuelensis]UPA12552.1 DUF244 domain-containing protein [Borrelia venezuelensis]